MKKIFLTMGAVLTALSMSADPIDLERAQEIASDFMVNEGPTLVKKATRNESKARKVSAQVRSCSPYYIFSRGAGQGFVIVSGDDCLPEVLGYTEQGDFVEDEMPPQLLSWLDAYARLIEEAQAQEKNASRVQARRLQRRAESSWADVPQLMSSAWHQSWPYNNRCPYVTGTTNRCATGCVATATSQVLYYFRKDLPETIQATTPTYSCWGGNATVSDQVTIGTPMKWELMLDNYNASHPSEYDDVVSTFVFAVGAALYMDYGYSSGAQTDDVKGVMSNYFGLTCDNAWKGSSDSDWAKSLYESLAAGSPIVYGGYKDGWTDGHAVVVDGYQASTGLFHFNFGWGGQGDGWFTVNDETGMNGWHVGQNARLNTKPVKQNLKGSLEFEEGFYYNHNNNVTLHVTNNGTLPYSGFYVFAATSDDKPTDIGKAKGSDTETVVAADGVEVDLSVVVKPNTTSTFYVTLTDANLNVLDQVEITPEMASNDLTFKSISIYGSTEKETHGGEEYTVVYGSGSTVVATVANNGNSNYEDKPRLGIYVSEDEGATWEFVNYKTAKSTLIEANSTGEMSFSVTSTTSVPIEAGKLYYAALANPLTAKSDNYVAYETTDTVVRFVVKETDDDLTATLDGTTLVFSGTWNAAKYNTLVSRSANSAATTYDLTAVKSVGVVPQVEDKPNALYYVADDVTVGGTNMIAASKADTLALTVGYDFCPKSAFTASAASLDLNVEPNTWNLITVPFNVTIPDGVCAKEITEHISNGINKRTQLVRDLEPGKAYMVMISSAKRQVVTGTNVNVAAAPAENLDTAVVGTFVATEAPAGACYLTYDDTQYFTPSDEAFTVEGLRGYFYATDVTKQFRANSDITLDPAYLKLGKAIEAAWQTLDEYQGEASDEAYQTLLDSIKTMEKLFTERTATKSSQVSTGVSNLSDAEDTYVAEAQTEIVEDSVNVDLTGLIINPSYELNASGNATGGTAAWTVEGSGVNYRSATNVYYRGVGADGDYLVQSFQSDSTGNSIHQVIPAEKLHKGLYKVSTKIATSPGRTVTVFANDQELNTEGHLYGQYYLLEVSIDSIVIMDGESIDLGIKAGDWYKVDDWHLTYVRELNSQEDPTAITTIVADEQRPIQDNRIYDVSGRRLRQLPTQPGIYIVGGKKIIIR